MDQLAAMRVFVAVAESAGFAPAARRLGMSSTAVSRHIADLEDHLSARLLHRTTRRVNLTEAGQRYLARAHTVLEQVAAMDAEAADSAAKPAGRLRITAVPVFGEQFLAPVAVGFVRRYPDIQLDLNLNERVVDIVAEGFDAAIRSGPLPDSSFRSRVIAEPRYVLCASPDYVARAGTPQHPSDLAQHECVHWNFRGPTFRWRFIQGGERIEVGVSGRFSVTSALAQAHAVRAGLGVAMFLPGVVEQDLAQGRMVRVLEAFEAEPAKISLVWPAAPIEPLRLRVFIDFLVSALHKAGAPRSEGEAGP